MSQSSWSIPSDSPEIDDRLMNITIRRVIQRQLQQQLNINQGLRKSTHKESRTLQLPDVSEYSQQGQFRTQNPSLTYKKIAVRQQGDNLLIRKFEKDLNNTYLPQSKSVSTFKDENSFEPGVKAFYISYSKFQSHQCILIPTRTRVTYIYKKNKPKQISLQEIKGLIIGSLSSTFQNCIFSYSFDQWNCFSLVGQYRTFDFICSSWAATRQISIFLSQNIKVSPSKALLLNRRSLIFFRIRQILLEAASARYISLVELFLLGMIIYCRKTGKIEEESVLMERLKSYFTSKHRFFRIVRMAQAALTSSNSIQYNNKEKREWKRINRIDLRRFQRLHKIIHKTPKGAIKELMRYQRRPSKRNLTHLVFNPNYRRLFQKTLRSTNSHLQYLKKKQ